MSVEKMVRFFVVASAVVIFLCSSADAQLFRRFRNRRNTPTQPRQTPPRYQNNPSQRTTAQRQVPQTSQRSQTLTPYQRLTPAERQFSQNDANAVKLTAPQPVTDRAKGIGANRGSQLRSQIAGSAIKQFVDRAVTQNDAIAPNQPALATSLGVAPGATNSNAGLPSVLAGSGSNRNANRISTTTTSLSPVTPSTSVIPSNSVIPSASETPVLAGPGGSQVIASNVDENGSIAQTSAKSDSSSQQASTAEKMFSILVRDE